MRKSYLLIFLSGICLHLFAFEFEGNPKSWDKEDFIGFDRVGDCTSHIGDISSVFTRIENDKLFLRITFDDMYSRKINVDNFTDKNIQIKLIITTENDKLFHKSSMALSSSSSSFQSVRFSLRSSIMLLASRKSSSSSSSILSRAS